MAQRLYRLVGLSIVLSIAIILSAGVVRADTLSSANADNPPTVASINLCTDQLVMLLAEPDQILSLSNLSHDQAGSYLYEQARQYPVNKGESEAILALDPELILAGQYTTKPTVKMLSELGFRVELVPIANTLEQLYDNITNVATWLGRSEKGVAMVANLRKRVAVQQQHLASQTVTNPTAAYYDPNGYTVGAESLRGLALTLSGWTNVAAKLGIEHYGSMPLESVIGLDPDAIIDSPYSVGTYSRAQQLLQHPALRNRGLNPLIISIPSRQTICAGPWTVDMIELLAAKRVDFLAASR